MPRFCRFRIATLLGLVLFGALGGRAQADDWLPVTPAELQMTAEPKAPGAAAVYLYRQVDRDDVNFLERHYLRIKVLTDAGRKYGSVELYYQKKIQHIEDVSARTISPSGAIAKFDGMVYDKPIVEGRGADMSARTFTLPGVEVGSIIEYRYTVRLPLGYIYNSQWVLSQELFTEHARFSLLPNTYFGLRTTFPLGLPEGTSAPTRLGFGTIRLETHDVPAFVNEDFMPPGDEVKYRVEFIYLAPDNPEKDPGPYWQRVGSDAYRKIADFLDRPKAMTQALAQISPPEDSAETRLRKIYTRVQQLTNTTYAPALTEEESKRQNPDSIHNVEDVWKQGRGDADQLDWLFIALARAAGIQADPALVSSRDSYFFSRNLMNPWKINGRIVIATLNGKDLFLDPGNPSAAFGQLEWAKTDVSTLRLDKHASTWLTTPNPEPAESLVERQANLQLSREDLLSGTVTVRYTGQEALWRRDQERNEDDTARRAFLEQDLAGSVPVGGTFKLTNSPEWKSPDTPLVAEFTISIPGWANFMGRRVLFPVGLFSSAEKQMFTSSGRVQPLYFSYRYRHIDEVTVNLPTGMSVTSVPGTHDVDLKGVAFLALARADNQALHVRRELTLNATLVSASTYEPLRKFFELVRSSDEEQAVLSPTPSVRP
jgi:Domain of Unknown Function with PDB structure (DUF3857)/Transglutaminase-like superfamily